MAHSTEAAGAYPKMEKNQAPTALPSAPLHKSLLWAPMGDSVCTDLGSPFGALFRYLSISDTSNEAARPPSNHTTT